LEEEKKGMQQAQQKLAAVGKVSNPAEEIKTQTLTLIAANSVKWDQVQIGAGRNAPQVIIWGTGTAQRCFLKDSGKTYKECSWIVARMPDYRPM
jgi:hypothetical protein